MAAQMWARGSSVLRALFFDNARASCPRPIHVVVFVLTSFFVVFGRFKGLCVVRWNRMGCVHNMSWFLVSEFILVGESHREFPFYMHHHIFAVCVAVSYCDREKCSPPNPRRSCQ